MEREKNHFVFSVILVASGVVLFVFLVLYSSFYQKTENEKFELWKKVQEELNKNENQNQNQSQSQSESEESSSAHSAGEGSGLPISSGDGESLGVPIDLGGAATASNGERKQFSRNSISLNTKEWKSYKNSKYNYSFKYPQEFDFSDCSEKNPCKFGQVFEKDEGKTAWLSGDIQDKGWPFIIISTADDELHNLPKKKKLLDWLKEKFTGISSFLPQDYNTEIPSSRGKKKKAVMVNIPQSPQAYARTEIYFEIDNKIFEMQLIDSNKPEAKKFYDTWLSTFLLN